MTNKIIIPDSCQAPTVRSIAAGTIFRYANDADGSVYIKADTDALVNLKDGKIYQSYQKDYAVAVLPRVTIETEK